MPTKANWCSAIVAFSPSARPQPVRREGGTVGGRNRVAARLALCAPICYPPFEATLLLEKLGQPSLFGRRHC